MTAEFPNYNPYRIEEIKDKLDPIFRDTVSTIAVGVEKSGASVVIFKKDKNNNHIVHLDTDSGDYAWVCRFSYLFIMDGFIKIEMLESENHDGSENGLNFRFSLRIGNETAIEVQPYDFTEHCWVNRDDEEAIVRRIEEFGKDLQVASETIKERQKNG